MKANIDGAVVAITGGTGSFGSTMASHLLEIGVEEIRIFSRDEAKQDFMRRTLNDARMSYYIGDVRDRTSLERVFDGVSHVFHAAALKQVPSCEFFPQEAVKTNVLGSANVLEAATSKSVKSVVCLSTDKAVYPINAMGISKALMEKTAQAHARSNDKGPVVSVTRYGNVLMSRGSVVPMFIHQIKNGLPLTITDPQMTRFLMTLDESVGLVNYAFRNATSGDLFVRKAPACTVNTLALAVAGLFGITKPDVQRIGTRHGEKLYETLLSREEMVGAIDNGDYFRVAMDSRSLDYDGFFVNGDTVVETREDFHSHNTEQLEISQVQDLLMSISDFRSEVEATAP